MNDNPLPSAYELAMLAAVLSGQNRSLRAEKAADAALKVWRAAHQALSSERRKQDIELSGSSVNALNAERKTAGLQEIPMKDVLEWLEKNGKGDQFKTLAKFKAAWAELFRSQTVLRDDESYIELPQIEALPSKIPQEPIPEAHLKKFVALRSMQRRAADRARKRHKRKEN